MSTPPLPPQPGPQPGFEQVIVPPAPQQPTGYPPAPSQVYAPAAAAKSSNTVLKIILAVAAIFVFFGVLAAAIIGFGAYKLSKAVHNASRDGVSFSTPNGGSITTGNSSSISSADIGLPEYPGAKRAEGSMKMKTSSGSLITVTYTTTDSQSQVVDFYKSKMGEETSIMESGNGTILATGENSRDKKVVTVTSEGSSTKISVSRATDLH